MELTETTGQTPEKNEPQKESARPPARKRKKKLPFTMEARGKAGYWRAVKMVKGTRHYAEMHTPDRALAEIRAWDWYNKLMAGEFKHIDAMKSHSGFAKLATIKEAYLRATDVKAKVATREHNWAELEGAVRLVLGAVEPGEVRSDAVLLGEFWRKWKRARLDIVEAGAAGNLLLIESGKRSLNSTLAHIKSIFCEGAVEAYASLSLPEDGVDEVAAVAAVPAKKQPRPTALSDELVARIFRSAGTELRTSDAASWVAFWLMVGGGFRNIEAAHSRTHWFVREAGGWRVNLELRADFMPKGTEGDVILPLAVMDEIMALPRESDFVVPGATKTERESACYRRLNIWLAGMGMAKEGHKRAYRLRRHFVQQVRKQFGALAAQDAARHGHFSTTSNNYLAAEKMAAPVDFSAALAAPSEAK